MTTGTNADSFGVVGLGYAGLPLALALAEEYPVIGVDLDEEHVETLRRGHSSIDGIDNPTLQSRLNEGLSVTTSYESLSECEAVAICVPTPLYASTEAPDLRAVADAAERLADVIGNGTTVILESTVYPGATEEIVIDRLTKHGFSVGEDVYVAFSPERIVPGDDQIPIEEIPKVLGGYTTECGDHAEAAYDPVFDEVVRVESPTEAELAKLLENTFRAVNIAFVNELAIVADALDVDIWNVIEAAATKPFGFMPFYPGPGFGGHCIPIDPAYLTWQAHRLGVETQFIDVAARVNHRMPRFVVSRIEELVDGNGPRLIDCEVLVIGVAYKPGVSDTRESPAYETISLLEQAGANVAYHDPHVPTFETDDKCYESIELEEPSIAEADCVVVLTDHPSLDLDSIVESASLVFDTRNATAGSRADHVHLL